MDVASIRKEKDLIMINKNKNNKNKCKRQNTNKRYANSKKFTNVNGTSRDDIANDNVRDENPNNDPSWYNASNQLVIDACSVGFATPLGLPLTAHGFTTNVPGIMRIDYVPSIGLSENNVSPINMAAQSIYSYVNYANSRNTSYDRTDMMLFLIAMDSAYAYLSHLKRIYGLARLYSATNRYLPNSLLFAMNVNPFDITSNLNDFRAYINTYAAKLGSFFVPASFTYLQRHAWMNYNVFSDSDKPFKSQLYFYYQQAYYKYNETNSDQGTALIYTPLPTTVMKFQDLATFGESLLTPLLNSQDVGIMGSDMLKAFGESGLIKMNTIDSDFTIDIAYSPEVLTQIQNTVAVGDLSVTQHLADITQNNTDGTILQTLKAQRTSNGFNNGAVHGVDTYFLNMPMVNPTPDNVMVATRNMSWVDANLLVHSGSEVVTNFRVFNNPKSPSSSVNVITSSIVTKDTAADALDIYSQTVSSVVPFNMHPRIVVGAIYGTGSNTDAIQNSILCDFENYTPLPVVDLQKMHEVALLSMFAVPQYGTFNG